ncbi:ribonuclease H-like domain-containing protein [Tanacetum coccineum]
MKKYEEEWESIGCSIMTDAWSDRKRRSIMNLCVNSKLGTVFISAKDCSDKAHTSEHIFEYIDKCIEDVGAENVVQVVTDNASNNMGAAKFLFVLEAIGRLPMYKKTLDQAKMLTVFIYAHHKTLALMRQFTKKRDINGKMEISNVKGKTVYALVLNAAFWAGVTTCLNVFAPLVKVLRMVDADWKPSIANWWKSYGGSAPNLRTIAIRILSLTTSSLEVVHTKKRNRLEVAKMNNLVYVQANANLMEHNKKRKVRNHEILLGENASEAQEWIVEFDNAHWEAVGDALGVEDELRPRTSARNKERELFEDDFVSGSEEEVDEVEYESDGAQIIEQYGQDKN